MKTLADCREQIHSCSKCGLCQSVCPIYKITGNDCTVSRGQFLMLQGLLRGEYKMSKTINKYLDICLKCGACSKFCPSGIDVVDIIALAKAEYYKAHFFEKIISFFQKYLVFGFGLNLMKLFSQNRKSQKFEKKVIYFGGCGGKLEGNASVVKLLNSCGVEVVAPDFDCCGIPFFVRGDMDNFNEAAKKFYEVIQKYNISEVVTSCASCEKTLKSYKKWFDTDEVKVRNVYEYIRENNLKLKLNKKLKVTIHKPCNMSNFGDVEWILSNTENLEYIKMKDFDSCCGFNGLTKPKQYKVTGNLFKAKQNNIIDTGCKYVLTSCLGCKTALSSTSFGKYKVKDFAEFLNKYIK